MTEYKAYPKYKSSGTDWLGEIPDDWKLQRLASLFTKIKETGFEDEELLSVYRDYGVIPKTGREVNKPSDDLSPYQLVKKNDLVVNKLLAWQGSMAISGYRGIVSPAYLTYRARKDTFTEKLNLQYIHYLLRSKKYTAQYMRCSKGIRVNQWDLDPDKFKNLELLIPGIEEQENIARFIDDETTKIDRLIEKQQRLIELLKEKRQAVISYAVTKGLDPKAKMKDSAVKWLGEVPANWKVTRVKFICSLNPPKSEINKENHELKVTFLPMEKVTDKGKIDLDESKNINEVFHGYTYFKNDDVLLAKITPCFENGKGAVCKNLENGIGFGSTEFHVFRSNKNILPEYIYYLTKTHHFRVFGDSEMRGAAGQKRVTDEYIKNYKIAFPGYAGQQEIVAFISRQSGKFDDLERKAERAITIMKERRISLISAAVTGKVDVRNWNKAVS